MPTVGISDRAMERLNLLRGRASRLVYLSGLIDGAYDRLASGKGGMTIKDRNDLEEIQMRLAGIASRVPSEKTAQDLRNLIKPIGIIIDPRLAELYAADLEDD